MNSIDKGVGSRDFIGFDIISLWIDLYLLVYKIYNGFFKKLIFFIQINMLSIECFTI